ncbi:MAG TPA: LysR family transcriptional regulator, partial [Polyangiales bacterium]|nr:LysR family transcriptional regulator [Polyangiales bacterium]
YGLCMQDIARRAATQLEVRELKLVRALAEARSTARAAALLHLTQPAISRALLALESKLDTQLFERTPRGLEPTAPGRELLAGAEHVLTALLDLETRVRMPRAEPSRLRIVCECYTAYHWLPSSLRRLRETLPEFDVSLAVEHTAEPVPALEAGAIDAALLTTARVPRGPLRECALFADEVVFVLASSHPLARKRTLSRADLRAHTLLSSKPPPGETQWFMNAAFGRAQPKLRFERLPLTEAIIEMARAGLGIAVQSEWIMAPYLTGSALVRKRLASGPLLRPWRMAYRRESEAAALRLATVLRATVPHLPG